MTPEHWKLVSELFDQASRLAEPERSAFLKRRCNQNEALRNEVESLLAHQRVDDSIFNDSPPANFETHERSEFNDWIGRSIASFRLKRVLSAGGMGVVFLAEQESPKRSVAIKMLHRGLLFGNVRRRFEFEAQILGRLRHPCIADIYEAGCGSLTPPPDPGPVAPMHFFAMEYIDGGRTLIEFARSEKYSICDRMKLFLRICDGVHHGHQKGVIHRDLKPDNILVTEDEHTDGTRVALPKIIDFGVAKCMNTDIARTTMQTTSGDLIGTLQYMSPEQCGTDALSIDTRTDVYALGMILFELLTERVPYDVSNRTIQSAVRIITETEPQTASHFDKRLRGAPDVIINKALEKDRDHRYGSAAELASDVRRYLDGEPIAASPPSRWRKAASWVGSHPVFTSVIASVLVAAMIIGSAIGTKRYFADVPVAVVPSSDQMTATMFSATGEALADWTSASRFGFCIAELERIGGRNFVILGEGRDIRNPLSGHIRVFDAAKPGTPLWEDRPSDKDVPEAVLSEDRHASDLNPVGHYVADFFPDSAGHEIAVWFSVSEYSQRCLRIYRLNDGTPLFQVWQDGGIADVHWLSGPQLLVLVVSDEDYKRLPPKGTDVSPQLCPAVVAIRIEAGKLRKAFITREPGSAVENAIWYRYLMIDDLMVKLANAALHAPLVKHDPCCHVRINCTVGAGLHPPAFTCTIDQDGMLVPESMLPGDLYSLMRERDPDSLPDLNTFKLVNEPPEISPDD